MGVYLNPNAEAFRTSLRSAIYVDKSLLIGEINKLIGTEQKYICVSRPRRFGKSMAANMLAAYYSSMEKPEELFEPLNVSQHPSYREYLGQYNVLKLNMQDFLSATATVEAMLQAIQHRLLGELHKEYGSLCSGENLIWDMEDIFAVTKKPFIILIDEWDCIFRDKKYTAEDQKKYLDFLRLWLKDKAYVALAYMTGILPIKKYGTHSALNMFSEYSMTNSGPLAPYFGFTEAEVAALCQEHGMCFDEVQAWYDGYNLSYSSKNGRHSYSIYSPKSVVEALLRHTLDTYWNQTETYEALRSYIIMDIAGLKKSIVEMLSGAKLPINIGTFVNDMNTFSCKDDILTLLVHLGYLSYDETDKTVALPNKEVATEYLNAISTSQWSEVNNALEASSKLLEDLWQKDARAVAAGIAKAHQEISILEYNDENSLSCTIGLAFYYAQEYYTIVRELPAGKGYADICFIPRRKHGDKPAIIMELKYDKGVGVALEQIKERAYFGALKEYRDNMLLVGIGYDKRTKEHSCVIERLKIEE